MGGSMKALPVSLPTPELALLVQKEQLGGSLRADQSTSDIRVGLGMRSGDHLPQRVFEAAQLGSSCNVSGHLGDWAPFQFAYEARKALRTACEVPHMLFSFARQLTDHGCKGRHSLTPIASSGLARRAGAFRFFACVFWRALLVGAVLALVACGHCGSNLLSGPGDEANWCALNTQLAASAAPTSSTAATTHPPYWGDTVRWGCS